MYDLAVMGDINGDLKADVLYYDWAGRGIVVTVDDAGDFRYRTLTDVSYPRAVNREQGMAIALANTDDDSYVAEYRGHYVIYTNPVIVAVVASSPYYGDITYPGPIGHHHTTYGNTAAVTDRTKQSHAIQASLIIGYAWGSKIFYDADATFEAPATRGVFPEFSGGVTWGKYNVYEYKVISAPSGNRDGGGESVAPGDCVLFSPGCASFGMFLNKFDRGRKWKAAVTALLRCP